MDQKELLRELEESDELRELDCGELAIVVTLTGEILSYPQLHREKRQERESGEASPQLKRYRRLRRHVEYTKALRRNRKSRHASEPMNPDPVADESSTESPPQENKTAKKNGKRGRKPSAKIAERRSRVLEFNQNVLPKEVVQKLKSEFPKITTAIVRAERSRKK